MEDSSIGLSGTPVYELLLLQSESFSLLPSGGCQGTGDVRTSEMDSQCPGLFNRRSSASCNWQPLPTQQEIVQVARRHL